MSSVIKERISKKDLGCFLLYYQGLLGEYRFENKRGIEQFINKVKCIQYDPVDICGKSPEIVLFSRVKQIRKEMLYDLLYTERKLIDYWDKKMSIFSVEDWPYFERIREKYRIEEIPEIDLIHNEIIRILEHRNFVSSNDFQYTNKITWHWGATSLSRAALEEMYFRGELGIHHKNNQKKYYALIKHLLPSNILNESDSNRTEEEFLKWYILRRIQSVGVVWGKPSDIWMNIPVMGITQIREILEGLLHDGYIIKVISEDNETFYCSAECIDYFNDIEIIEKKNKTRMEFIAPLDNILWDRKMIYYLFGFKYKWEMYIPDSKREFGAYVLPILYKNQFIGRIQMKKAKDELILQKIWFEDEKVLDAEFIDLFLKKIELYKKYLDCKSYKIEFDFLYNLQSEKK